MDLKHHVNKYHLSTTTSLGNINCLQYCKPRFGGVFYFVPLIVRITFLIGLAFSFAFQSFGQNPRLSLGPEYNYYPAGHIVGLQAECTPKNNHHSFNFRVASNITKRWDFSGLNDDEQGIGFGGGLGYRYYFTPDCHGLFLGARTNFWRINVNWQDSSELMSEGMTKIGVIQPEFEIGYLFMLKNGWNIGTAFVNGVELNVMMVGEPVGEGWITLWQLRVAKELNLTSDK